MDINILVHKGTYYLNILTITFLRIIIVEIYMSFLGLLKFRYISNAKFYTSTECCVTQYECIRVYIAFYISVLDLLKTINYHTVGTLRANFTA